MAQDGTVLVATGLDRRSLLRVFGQNNLLTRTNAGCQIADDYVPVGATNLHLRNASGLKPGDLIRITRPSTAAWIERLGATELGGGVGSGWRARSRDIVWERTITSVSDNLVAFDAPLTTAIERCFGA